MNSLLSLAVLFQPPVPPPGPIGPVLPAWLNNLNLGQTAVYIIGIALAIWFIVSLVKGNITLPGIFSIATAGALIGAVVLGFIVLFQPQIIVNAGITTLRPGGWFGAASELLESEIARDDLITVVSEENVLDPVPRERIWRDVNPDEDLRKLINLNNLDDFTVEITGTNTLSVTNVGLTTNAIEVKTDNVTLVQSYDNIVGEIAANAFAVANHAATAPAITYDDYMEVVAHATNVAYFSTLAHRDGLIADPADFINRTQEVLHAAIPKVVGAAQGCEQLIITQPQSELMWSIERERAKMCSIMLRNRVLVEQGKDPAEQNQTLIAEHTTLAMNFEAVLANLGSSWAAYQTNTSTGTAPNFGTGTPLD